MSGTSYTNIFGGKVIIPAYQSYIQYTLTSLIPQINLTWPSQFVDSANYVSNIIQVEATTTGTSLVMPDATLVSVGQSTLIVNNGVNSVIIYENDATTVITTLTAGQSEYIYLTDNTTTNGTWSSILFGSGSLSPVTSVGIASSSPDLTVSGSPITSSGVITLGLAEDLAQLTSFGSGVGIPARTGTNTWALRTLMGTANQTLVANGDGVAANPTVLLAQNISGITSITASNVQIGVGQTNTISTADMSALLLPESIYLRAVGASGSPSLRWYDADNTNYVAFKAAETLTVNTTWTLPLTDGTINQVLTTDGAGNLSWTDGGGGGGAVSSVNGTANRIAVSPTTGVVVVDIDAAYVGQASITTLGVIATGTWEATLISPTFGGSGVANPTAHGILIGEGSSPFNSVVLTNNQLLVGVTGSDPVGTLSPTGLTSVGVGNLTLSGTTITSSGAMTISTGANGDLSLEPNGSGSTLLKADPTQPLGAVTKQYVDAIAAGLIIQPSAFAATTANLTATYNNGASGVGATLTNSGTQAVFTIDGVSPSVSDRVLIKNQTTQAQNGIYVVTDVGSISTNWVLTRAANYDTNTEITPGDLVIITDGTVNAITSWVQTATVVTVGTDPVIFNQFTYGATIVSVSGTANRITVTPGNAPVVDIASTYVGQTSLTTLGTITTGTWNATPVTVPYGGTGNTTFTAYSIICAGTTATGPFQNVVGTGTATQVLTSNGAGALPSWQDAGSSLPPSVTGQNMLVNGGFQVAQRGAGGSAVFSVPASSFQYTLDRWQMATSGSDPHTVSQIYGPNTGLSGLGGIYLCKIQRNPGATGTNSSFAQSLTRIMSAGAAGNSVTVSFRAIAGANYSPVGGALKVRLYTGTGTTDSSCFSGWTGAANQVVTVNINAVSLATYTATFAIPSNVTQIATVFNTDSTGTAGADDSYYLTNVKTEIGTVATGFAHESFQAVALQCYPFYQKSFEYTTAPAQNVGAFTGEFNFLATVASPSGTNNNSSGGFYYSTPLNPTTAYTLTTYNPAFNNAEMYRNTLSNASFVGTNLRNSSHKMFELNGLAPAGTIIGYLCGVHWAVDCELN